MIAALAGQEEAERVVETRRAGEARLAIDVSLLVEAQMCEYGRFEILPLRFQEVSRLGAAANVLRFD